MRGRPVITVSISQRERRARVGDGLGDAALLVGDDGPTGEGIPEGPQQVRRIEHLLGGQPMLGGEPLQTSQDHRHAQPETGQHAAQRHPLPHPLEGELLRLVDVLGPW
ncbi:hypothetical protein GCM10023160_02540 [Brachybacterium paraconglomeratum]